MPRIQNYLINMVISWLLQEYISIFQKQFFDIILRMSEPNKRLSRKDNRCGSVLNPFSSQQTQGEYSKMFPDQLKYYLHCYQISSFPQLSFPSPQQFQNTLQQVKMANEWQSSFQKQIKIQKQMNKKTSELYGESSNLDDSKEKMFKKQQNKGEGEKSIYSVLLQGELQDFIMNPPPGNYDFEYQYEAPQFYVPISNNDLSYPNDIHEFGI